VPRFSISVNDESAAWIETKAEERGVSKSKIVRDAIKTAKQRGFVRNDDVGQADAKSLSDKIENLETRIEALESAGGYDDTNETAGRDLIPAFKRQLRGQPPTKEHGKEAVTRIFELLLSQGTLTTQELRDQLAPEFEEHFSNKDSMWQSYQRNLPEIDGIVKVEQGRWKADPDAVDTEPGGLSNWDES